MGSLAVRVDGAEKLAMAPRNSGRSKYARFEALDEHAMGRHVVVDGSEILVGSFGSLWRQNR